MEGLVQMMSLIFDTSTSITDTDILPEWYEGNEFRAIREASLAEQPSD